MTTEFRTSVVLDAERATQNAISFGKSVKKASTVLEEFQTITKKATQGGAKNVFRQYENSINKLNVGLRKNVATMHDRYGQIKKNESAMRDLIKQVEREKIEIAKLEAGTKKAVKANKALIESKKRNIAMNKQIYSSTAKNVEADKKTLGVMVALNRKYDENARVVSEAKRIRNELNLVVASGLKTKKEALRILKEETEKLRQSTQIYKEKAIAEKKAADVKAAALVTEKKAIATATKLSQKYNESARILAKAKTIRNELNLVQKQGLITKQQASEALSKEVIALRKSTKAYKDNENAVRKSASAKEAEKAKIEELRLRYDKVYNSKKKLARVESELTLLRRKGKITSEQKIAILKREKKAIDGVTNAQVRSNKAHSFFATVARKVSIMSRVLLVGYLAIAAVKMWASLAKTADAVQLLGKKLEYLTGDSGAFGKFYEMTQKVGIGLKDAGKIMTRFAVVTRGAFSTDRMTEWVATLTKSGRAVGTSTQEMTGALIQITQAMSAGRLMGDEYRSVTENLPLLTIELRKVFKGTTLSLKEMSSLGLITTQDIVQAIESMKDSVDKMPGSLDTVEARIGALGSAWEMFIAKITNTSAFKSAVDYMTDNLNLLIGLLNTQYESELQDIESSIESKTKNLKRLMYGVNQNKLRVKAGLDEIDVSQDTKAKIKEAQIEINELIIKKQRYYAQGATDLKAAESERIRIIKKANDKERILDARLKIDLELNSENANIAKLETQRHFQIRAAKLKTKFFGAELKGEFYTANEFLQKRQTINEDFDAKIVKLKIKSAKANAEISSQSTKDQLGFLTTYTGTVLEIQKKAFKDEQAINKKIALGRAELAQGLKVGTVGGVDEKSGVARQAENAVRAQKAVSQAMKVAQLEIDELVGDGGGTSKYELYLTSLAKLKTEEGKASAKISKIYTETSTKTTKLAKAEGVEQAKLTKVYKNKRKELEKAFKLDYQKMYSKASIAANEYEESVNSLNDAYKVQAITLIEYNYHLDLAKDLLLDQSEAALVATGSLTKLEEAQRGVGKGVRQFKDKINSVYNVFSVNTDKFLTESSDAFANFLTNGENAFDSLKESAKSMVKSIIAGLIKIASQRIVLSIAGSMSVAGSANAGVGGIVQSITGGNGFSGIMDTASSVYNLVTGNSIGQGFASAGQAMANYAPSFFGTPELVSQAPAMFGGGSVLPATPGTLGTSGSIFQGAAQYGNLAYGAAGLVGGLGAGALFGNDGYASMGGSLGATAGLAGGAAAASAMGMKLGAWGGPLGALAGMVIGGAIGSLFGGKKAAPKTFVRPSAETQESYLGKRGISYEQSRSVGDNDIAGLAESVFGSIAISTQHDVISNQEMADSIFGFMDSMAQADNVLASILTDSEIAKVKTANLDQQGLKYKKSLPLDDFYSTRIKTIFEEIGGDMEELFDALSSGFSDDDLANGYAELMATVAVFATDIDNNALLFGNLIVENNTLADDITTTIELFKELSKEDEKLIVTYARLTAESNMYLSALNKMEIKYEGGIEDFIRLSSDIVEAAGGFEEAGNLWSVYFNTFASSQSILTEAFRAGKANLEILLKSLDTDDLGLTMDNFQQRFEEAIMGGLSGVETVNWLGASQFLSQVDAMANNLMTSQLGLLKTAIDKEKSNIQSSNTILDEEAAGKIGRLQEKRDADILALNDSMESGVAILNASQSSTSLAIDSLSTSVSASTSAISSIESAISFLDSAIAKYSNSNASTLSRHYIGQSALVGMSQQSSPVDVELLRAAVADVGRLPTSSFASSVAFAKDNLVTANALSSIKDGFVVQLSTEQLMLGSLQAQLSIYESRSSANISAVEDLQSTTEDEIDAINDQFDSQKLLIEEQLDLDKKDSLSRMQELDKTYDYWSALVAIETQSLDALLTIAQLTASLKESTAPITKSSNSDFIEQLYTKGLGRDSDSSGFDHWMSVLDSGISRDSLVDSFQAAAQRSANENPFDINNISTFATGGYHNGGLRIVGENGPELEMTGPSRILSNRDSVSMMNNEELINEIRALRADIKAGNYSVAKSTLKTQKLMSKWESIGMPVVRDEV